jgi:hypothetical protein
MGSPFTDATTPADNPPPGGAVVSPAAARLAPTSAPATNKIIGRRGCAAASHLRMEDIALLSRHNGCGRSTPRPALAPGGVRTLYKLGVDR